MAVCLLYSVYTIQPVVNRFDNRIDNRLYRVNGVLVAARCSLFVGDAVNELDEFWQQVSRRGVVIRRKALLYVTT